MKAIKAVSPKVTAEEKNKMNNQSKHTPGTWEASPVIRWSSPPVDTFSALVISKAYQNGCKRNIACASADGRDLAECEANARLIASAPELLTMLVAVEISLKMNGDDKKYPTMMEAINSAISHAEGK